MGIDRQGLATFSNITCRFDYNEVMGNNNDYYLSNAVKITNRVLEIYRLKLKEFYVVGIKENIIFQKNVMYINDDGTVTGNIMQSFAGGITIATHLQIDGETRRLLTSDEPFPLWEISLNNAKNYYDLGEYRQTIVEINIALENFIYTHIYQRLSRQLAEEEISQLVAEKSPCTSCRIQTDPENPQIVVQPHPPSIHKIIKDMYRAEPIIGMTTTRLRSIIDKITRYRNSIVHGRQVAVSARDAREAIEKFEQLVNESFRN